MSETNEKYISISDATEITKLSRVWLFNLYRQGRIPGAQKIGHDVVIPREWAEEERRRRAASVTTVEAAMLARVTTQTIRRAVNAGAIERVGYGRISKESLLAYIEAREGK